MCPKTKEQFEEIRVEKRKLIMDTALHLFAVKGFHQTSISEIAKEANISKGLMYNYFDSKESLLAEIFQAGFDQAYLNFDQNQDGILQTEEFIAFIHRLKTIVDENQSFWQLLIALILQPGAVSLSNTNIRGMEEINALLIEYFKTLGYKNPQLEMTFCTSLLLGAFVQYLLSPQKYPIDEVIGKVIKMYT